MEKKKKKQQGHYCRQSGGVQGDFSIRFQHMGEGLNAILFRIGIGF